MASIAEQIEQAERDLTSLQEQVKADLASLRERLGLNSSPQLFSSTATSGSSAVVTNISTSKPKAKRNGNGSRKRARSSVPAGQRKQQIVDAVRTNPGTTVAEMGDAFGVDPQGLYRDVRKLEAEGLIRKDGKQLFPVGEGDTVGPAPAEVPAA